MDGYKNLNILVSRLICMAFVGESPGRIGCGEESKEVLGSGGTTNLYVWLWNGLGLTLALPCDEPTGVE